MLARHGVENDKPGRQHGPFRPATYENRDFWRERCGVIQAACINRMDDVHAGLAAKDQASAYCAKITNGVAALEGRATKLPGGSAEPHRGAGKTHERNKARARSLPAIGAIAVACIQWLAFRFVAYRATEAATAIAHVLRWHFHARRRSRLCPLALLHRQRGKPGGSAFGSLIAQDYRDNDVERSGADATASVALVRFDRRRITPAGLSVESRHRYSSVFCRVAPLDGQCAPDGQSGPFNLIVVPAGRPGAIVCCCTRPTAGLVPGSGLGVAVRRPTLPTYKADHHNAQ